MVGTAAFFKNDVGYVKIISLRRGMTVLIFVVQVSGQPENFELLFINFIGSVVTQPLFGSTVDTSSVYINANNMVHSLVISQL